MREIVSNLINVLLGDIERAFEKLKGEAEDLTERYPLPKQTK